jgi:hypothetical protein
MKILIKNDLSSFEIIRIGKYGFKILEFANYLNFIFLLFYKIFYFIILIFIKNAIIIYKINNDL